MAESGTTETLIKNMDGNILLWNAKVLSSAGMKHTRKSCEQCRTFSRHCRLEHMLHWGKDIAFVYRFEEVDEQMRSIDEIDSTLKYVRLERQQTRVEIGHLTSAAKLVLMQLEFVKKYLHLVR